MAVYFRPMSAPPPIPAQPVETLSYALPPTNRRPGILTAVGIISIVVGCLSGLSSCGGVFSGVMFATLSSRMFATPPSPATPTPPAPNASRATVTIGGLPWDEADMEDGLEPPETRKVTNVLSRTRSLSDPRRQHLGILLAAHGKVIFPTVTGSSSEADIARAITGGGITADGANWYTVGTGRIEINDQRAHYRPSTGTPVVEASAPIATPATQPLGVWQSHQSQGIIVSQSNGSGTTSTWSISTTPPLNPATGPAPAPVPVFNISPVAAWLSVGENVLSGAVAVLLLIAGILVLRDSPRARRLHWIYVAAKIPLIVVAAVATALMTSSMLSGVMAMPGAGMAPGFTTWMVVIQVVMTAAIALVYPVALIFVLRSRSVREYYESPDLQPP
jgi:hypothetical protein